MTIVELAKSLGITLESCNYMDGEGHYQWDGDGEEQVISYEVYDDGEVNGWCVGKYNYEYCFQFLLSEEV